MTTAISPAIGRVTSRYGARNTGIAGASTRHAGVDIAPPTPGQTGVPVRAPLDGTVIRVEQNSVRGLLVELQHTGGYTTLHQHLASATVKQGQKVRAAAQIGVMGASGVASGIHLHTEVRKSGTPIDPTPWYRARHAALGLAGAPGMYETTGTVRGRWWPSYSLASRRVLRRAGKRMQMIATSTTGWAVTKSGTWYPMKKLRKVK